MADNILIKDGAGSNKTMRTTDNAGIHTPHHVLAAGTAIAGKFGIDQTTPGTTNGVQVNAALPAGDNNIGNVDIVSLPSGNLGQQLNAASLSVTPATDIADATYIGDIKFGEALPAGTAIVGQFGIDQTTPGTTNGVQVVAALPAGTNAIGKLAANSGVDIGDVDVLSLPALPAGTNVIGKTGYKLVRVTTNFTRPADTTPYAVGDAVTGSTSAPAVFQLDVGAAGAVNGQALEIRKVAVVSSAKQATLPLLNVFLSSTTFTATNDNAALDIDDTTMELGGAWFACDVQNYTASNSRVAYFGCAQPLMLAAADSKLYGTIQATNAYTPVSEEKFTVVAWIALL